MEAPRSPLPQVLKPERKAGFGSVFLKSVLLFLGIALFAFAMKSFFGWVAFEKPDTAELYLKIRDGRTEVRRMAALEWLRLIQEAESRNQLRANAGTEADMLAPGTESSRTLAAQLLAREEGRPPDSVLTSSLAALLGYGDPSVAREALRTFLRGLKPEEMPEARIMALVSIVRLPEPGAEDLALVREAASHPDASVRKAAAFALGRMVALDGSTAKLRELLADSAQDVRWNAAIALGALGGSDGAKVLTELLERALSSGPNLRPDELQLFREALRAAERSGDASIKSLGQKVAQTHPNLKLRQSAKEIFTSP